MADYAFALANINARPATSRAYKYAPDRDLPEPNLYRFVLRRTDRFPDQVQRVNVSYVRGNALSRDITTPWDNVRAATLFLRDEREVLAAKGLGWRDDITEQWFASLDGVDVTSPRPVIRQSPPTVYPDFTVSNEDLENGATESLHAEPEETEPVVTATAPSGQVADEPVTGPTVALEQPDGEGDTHGTEEELEATEAAAEPEASVVDDPEHVTDESAPALFDLVTLRRAGYPTLQKWSKLLGISGRQSGSKLRAALADTLSD